MVMLVTLLAAILLGNVARGDDADDAAALERRIVRTFASGDHDAALVLVDRYIAAWPDAPHMRYNRACGLALLGRRDAAAAALLIAVERGFRDFEVMRRDPDLASIRTHPTFTAILEARRRLDRGTADKQFDAWRRRYGDDYHYETDEAHRLHFATGLDARAHADMKQIIARQATHLSTRLFKSPPLDWCLVVVPSANHVREVFQRMLDVSDPARTPGVYLHGKRLLVTRDIGESLRHEFTHRMHWAEAAGRSKRSSGFRSNRSSNDGSPGCSTGGRSTTGSNRAMRRSASRGPMPGTACGSNASSAATPAAPDFAAGT